MIETDTVFMKRALDQARRGAGLVSPNPMVGALLVKDGVVIGEGFHRYDLLKHGETYAIEMAGRKAKGSTLYCNLEPCCHHGRTPPCTDALIEAGIAKAVIATKDPYTKVNGKGIQQLRDAGIEVEVGLLEPRALKLNESYFKFVTTGRPFLHAVIVYPGDAVPPIEWLPSKELLDSASKYDAVMLGSRVELNRVLVNTALERERHRPPVVVALSSEPWLLDALDPRTKKKFSVVKLDTNSASDETGKVVKLDTGATHDLALQQMSDLFVTLTRMEVTSLLILHGHDDLAASVFSEFDKITLVLPTDSYQQSFATKWSFGDIEFNLEDVKIEQAGEFSELTGYPTVQEVA